MNIHQNTILLLSVAHKLLTSILDRLYSFISIINCRESKTDIILTALKKCEIHDNTQPSVEKKMNTMYNKYGV